MNSSYITEAPLRGILSVAIAEEDIAQDVAKEIATTQKSIEMPGFRKGKVPKSIIEKKYGSAIRFEMARKKAEQEMYRLQMEKEINSITYPLSEILKTGEDGVYEFRYTYPLTPNMEVEIDDKLEIPYYTIEVTDNDIEGFDERIRGAYAEHKEIDTFREDAFVWGKLIQLDADGNAVEDGLEVEDTFLTPKFFKDEAEKKKFEGVKKGDVLQFNLAKSFDNNSALLKRTLHIDSNQEALKYTGDFRFEITSIKAPEPPELNEEFFKKAFGEETAIKDEQSYKEELKNRLAKLYESESKHFFQQQLIDLLLDKAGRPELDEETLKLIIQASHNEKEENKENKLSDEELDNELAKFVNYIYYSETIKQMIKKLGIEHSQEAIREQVKTNIEAQMQQYGYDPAMMQSFMDTIVDKELEKEESVYQAVSQLNEKAITSDAFDKVTRKEETLDYQTFLDKVTAIRNEQLNKQSLNEPVETDTTAEEANPN